MLTEEINTFGVFDKHFISPIYVAQMKLLLRFDVLWQRISLLFFGLAVRFYDVVFYVNLTLRGKDRIKYRKAGSVTAV